MPGDARPQAADSKKNGRRIRCNTLRAHGATNKSHHVCARRRDGEAAGTGSSDNDADAYRSFAV
jgi:hypothetical protein